MQKIRLILSLLFLTTISLAAKPFTVVIDAGHGGKDPGAVGKFGYEKDVNLSVSLELGRLIRENMDDVRVVFTRDKDEFVMLQERSAMANRADGDLFICIHVNASKSRSAYGAETYTIGLAKSDANFEVAKRENSVILLEDGYKERYQGFDPSSPESYIMFEFMQSKFSDQSISLAAFMQDEFTAAKRFDRGVRQENFWVLHQTKMPSVLIELGFISNADEEKYLLSTKGQNQMAKAIYNAFARYKHEHDRKNGVSMVELPDNQRAESVAPKVEPKSEPKVGSKSAEKPAKNEGVVYKLQLFATSSQLKAGDSNFKGLQCDFYIENNIYKYTFGSERTFEAISKLKTQLVSSFPTAFVVAFHNGKRISLQEAKTISK